MELSWGPDLPLALLALTFGADAPWSEPVGSFTEPSRPKTPKASPWGWLLSFWLRGPDLTYVEQGSDYLLAKQINGKSGGFVPAEKLEVARCRWPIPFPDLEPGSPPSGTAKEYH
ncbi:hypothetical protein ACSJJU_10525 [Pedomonas sp. V897]